MTRRSRLDTAALAKKCGNLFVSAAQQLNDPDQHSGMMMVDLFTSAEFKAFNDLYTQLQGGDATRDYFHALSQGCWLEVCKQTLRCRVDIAGLERCGLGVGGQPLSVEGLSVTSPIVAYHDGLARSLGVGSFRLVRNRIGSQLQYHYYPMCLAGILKESTQAACMDRFRIHVNAWWKAKDLHLNHGCLL